MPPGGRCCQLRSSLPDLLLWLCCAGGSIEAVLIPMVHRRGTRRHITLCVSSQVSQQCTTQHNQQPSHLHPSGSRGGLMLAHSIALTCQWAGLDRSSYNRS
jgi:hypothetical protein